MPEPLTLDEVKHIARLARLRLSEDELETYRAQLSSVLEHVAKLRELDLDGVEPMAFSGAAQAANRLDEDRVDADRPLSIEQIAMNAPAMEDRFIAVPKVLGAGE